MRKSLLALAISATALLAASTAVQASQVVLLRSFDSSNNLLDSRSCDSSNMAACSPGFSLLSDGLGFTGTLTDFAVTFTSFTGNMPGTPTGATLDSSTTALSRTGTGMGFFSIDVFSTDYFLPMGGTKLISGSSTGVSSIFTDTGVDFDQVISRFFADGTNLGAPTNEMTCTFAVRRNNGCNSGAPVTWTDADGGSFSLGESHLFRLNGGTVVNTTGTVLVTPIPEPASLALVAAALLGLGVWSRRQAGKGRSQ